MKATLAGDKEVYMALSPTGVIIGDEGTEPIVPMGLLTTVLGCEISRRTQGLEVLHPQWGRLEVTVEDGCPVVLQEVAMKLIQQIESKAKHMAKILKMDTSSEAMWLRRLVEEHPAFQGVPDEIKSQLGTSR